MANRTYLIGLNEDFFQTKDVAQKQLLEAEYCIPLLWLSLFNKKDIRLYKGIPLLAVSGDEALDNLLSRMEGLLAFLGEPSREILQHWKTFIQQHEYAFYLINTAELAQMEEDPANYSNFLEEYFDELDVLLSGNSKEREFGILRQVCSELSEFPYEGKALHLCGFSFSGKLPWPEDVGTGEFRKAREALEKQIEQHAWNNKQEILASDKCVCTACGEHFTAQAVHKWWEEKHACCPQCGLAGVVIGSASGISLETLGSNKWLS